MRTRSAIELADRHLPPYRQGELAVLVERVAVLDGHIVRPVVRQATAELMGDDKGLFVWRDRPRIGPGHIAGLSPLLPMTQYLGLPEPAHVRKSETQYVALCMSAARKAGVRFLQALAGGPRDERWSGIAWLWSTWDASPRSVHLHGYGVTWHVSGELCVVQRSDAGDTILAERCRTLSDALAYLPDAVLDSAIALLAKPAATRESA